MLIPVPLLANALKQINTNLGLAQQNRFDGLASYRLEKSLLAQFIDMKISET
ncbi:hypothetical protein F2Q68_00039659 [Brassica cretica]|uniref:Uncharacterized protein n=1 Tax=Brassica cretica TaxID=69181 RepID=A0A8S9MG43_BRACR|nr:hypothetical protein F2Q68_00039659 [Brassica cretica]